jgi:putative endonuclease
MAMASRKDIGAWGEALAAKALIERGYVIRDRNWRHGRGELDIVAERAGAIVFVEVRTRRSDAFGKPDESITAHKRATLIATAQAYLQVHALDEAAWQIDAIVVELDARNAVSRLEHIEHAIAMPGGM